MKNKNGRFQKGRSGNPAGRPPGARNKATQAALALLDGEALTLSRKAVELALLGDVTALRLCLERIAPPAKEHPLSGMDLPEISSPADILGAISHVSEKLASGDILPSQAAALCAVFEQYRRNFETAELEGRIQQLEAASNAGSKR